MKIYDLSQPLNQECPFWPYYPPFEVKYIKRKAEHGVNAQYIQTSNHMGTHLDAPRHFVTAGRTIDEIPIEWLCGPGVIVDLRDEMHELALYTPQMIEKRVKVKQGDIILPHPGHTRDDRKFHWLTLLERFGGIEDWSGLEEERAYGWHRQPHLFTSPFYYIEYGIAQLGALQVWLKAKKDAAKAVGKYRQALALGRSRPLPELFRAAGIKFDFSARTVKPLVNALRRELRTLEEA